MLKNGIEVINKNGLHYIVGEGGTPVTFKPWLGDTFSFLYDFIMEKSVFPGKFGGDIILGTGTPTVTQEDFVLHPRLKRHYPRRITIYHSDGDSEVALTITLRNLAEEVDLLEDSGMNPFSQWITRTFVARPSYFRVSADFEGFVRRGNVKDRLSGECLYEVMIFE
ncbi:MAG: hypothetical protein AVO39_07605 [delta proteobacterium MLS_D]|jgi:hypothetical protein|nr:MAG: hypothetical protein AVO39_07605 [delta proteobacterium MLS_D]